MEKIDFWMLNPLSKPILIRMVSENSYSAMVSASTMRISRFSFGNSDFKGHIKPVILTSKEVFGILYSCYQISLFRLISGLHVPNLSWKPFFIFKIIVEIDMKLFKGSLYLIFLNGEYHEEWGIPLRGILIFSWNDLNFEPQILRYSHKLQSLKVLLSDICIKIKAFPDIRYFDIFWCFHLLVLLSHCEKNAHIW